MSDIAERYRRVADGFGAPVQAVPGGAWHNPAPGEGWVATDAVRHLVDRFPAFLTAAGGPPLRSGPSVGDDPAGAREAFDAGEVRTLLAGMEAHDEALRASGQYGAKVDVAADADEQTRLIAFSGRQP